MYVSGDLIEPDGNYELDKDSGRIFILEDAVDLNDSTLVEVNFEFYQVEGRKTASTLRPAIGALRYIATNRYGKRSHYFFPQVKISPVGQFDVKSDEWQQIQFEAIASNLTPTMEQVYVDSVETVGTTLIEDIMNEYGMTEEWFINSTDLDTLPDRD